jgi:UDP-N-acetylglucosamine--N-acetylmuramyl-(pentapeptide) pyrophosphoryl-undecaprenol N-acetylglucosamine transferase
MSVVLAGGGSAGHVSPLLALADCLRRREPSTRITVLGTAEGLEARLVPARGYDLVTVAKVPMPRRPNADLLRLGGRLSGAVRAAGEALDAASADVVVGFGGYVCPPAYLAARRRGLPIVIHEQNPLPGLANKLGARLTPYVATTFPGTPLPHATQTGMPLRREIGELADLSASDRAARRAQARADLGLDADRTTLLVFGGSLGAQRLNETFGAAAPDLRAAGVQVLHVSGVGKQVDVDPAADGEPPYVVVPYLDRIDHAFAAADLVTCRSGANTVCELATVALPAAYVPLPVGNGEQRLNAEPVVAGGGGLLVDDAACTPAWVREVLLPLLADPAALAAMGEAAGRFVVPHADDRLADLVCDAVEGRAVEGRAVGGRAAEDGRP